MAKPKYATREEWLHAVKDQIAPKFKEIGAPLPDNIRLTCGFPSHGATGLKDFVAGQCWPPKQSGDQQYEILISPRLEDFPAAETLVHELCHAADECKHEHKAPFVKIAKAMGLTGKMTSTKAGPELTASIERIMRAVGPYPHAPLSVHEEDKKQTTRMIKACCETCGYTCRVTRKWLEQDGPPICPAEDGVHGAMLADDPDDGGE